MTLDKEVDTISATEILLTISFVLVMLIAFGIGALYYSYPVVQFAYPGKECIRVIPANGQYSCSYLPQKYHTEWVSNKAEKGE